MPNKFNIASSSVIVTYILCCLIAACSPLSPPLSPSVGKPEKMSKPLEFDHSHKEFDKLLQKYVIDGWVDYSGILAESEALDRYVKSIGAVNVNHLETWHRNQKLAYWINAYNALTLLAIIERYPIKGRTLIGLFFPQDSILQISGIWNRLEFKAGGRSLTLGQIEHEILRKFFDEPRIHFAIACASRSCPALRSEAYRAETLDLQLDEQTIAFVNDPMRGVRWDTAKKRLYISKIFKWFKEDFKIKKVSSEALSRSAMVDNPVLAFIGPYIRTDTVKDAMAGSQTIPVSYLPYDWRLNDLALKE